jgi:predicted P-loop ATPase
MPSLFVNAHALKPEKTLSLSEIEQRIRKADKELKQTIELLRIEPDETLQTKMKRMLPAVTFSGDFSRRNASSLETHSSYYIYDLDGVNPKKMKKLIADEPSLLMAFMSPRANGLKVVLQGPIAEDAKIHKKFWEVGASIVEERTGQKLDRSGSDVCRLCFLSSDPGLIKGDGKEFDVKKVLEPSMKDEHGDIMRGVPEPKADFKEYTQPIAKEMLWAVGADLPYDKWRNIIWAMTNRFGQEEWVHDLLLRWSIERGGDRALDSEDDKKTFESVYAGTGKGITFASLIAEAKKAGWTDWRKSMRRDEDGELLHDDANLMIILTQHPDFKGRIWMDEITEQQMMSPKEDALICAVSRMGGYVEESLAFNVLVDIQQHLKIGFRGTRSVLCALAAIACNNKRNFRKEWLDELVWDGVPRLNRLFIDGFGAENVERNEALASAFMASAAARIMRPGVSVQVVPILMGPQGCGKSSGLKALCPQSEWFCDSFIDFESKAGYEVVLRASIVELSELSAIRKADMEKVKQFVTQQFVRFRAPYEKQTRDHAAAWVFIGTTNEEEFLKDTSGNRRFAPIKIVEAKVEKVVEWIEERREQLWAEAVTLCRRGFKNGADTWGIPKKYWDELSIAAEKARERDPWEDVLNEYGNDLLRKNKRVQKSLREISIESGLNLKGRSDELHLGKVLRLCGWERKVVRLSDKLARRWILGQM